MSVECVEEGGEREGGERENETCVFFTLIMDRHTRREREREIIFNILHIRICIVEYIRFL